MQVMENLKSYCSLDIETTGFDPLTEEILEVGFVFFEITKKGLKITEEWTQVFKPTKKVSPKILGLTGISLSELEKAPQFSEFKEFLQAKLGEAVIVGHNIAFDTKFLESNGLRFSGQLLDTMDLVQWLLPAHHSYNLENLMHYFKVPHTEAHRALADAKAALRVLERLLGIYTELPETVKTEVEEIIKPFNFAWQPLLSVRASKKADRSLLAKKSLAASASSSKTLEAYRNFKPVSGVVYDFPLFSDYAGVLLEKLKKSKSKSLLVLPKKHQVMEVWKSGLAHAVFQPGESFDKPSLEALIKKPQKTSEEARFALKLLVWQATNWQTEYLLDLNLTFFGGQFRSLVAKTDFVLNKEAKVWVCDTQTFLDLTREPGALKERFVAITGLPELETALGLGISHRVSWGFVSFILKSYYNPDTETGSESHKALVKEALNDADLFFGLASGLLRQNPEGFEYFRVSGEAEDSENYTKVKQAAQNYSAKLAAVAQSLGAKALQEAAQNLSAFFEILPNRVKWVELAEGRCVFYDNPINLKEPMETALKSCARSCFADSLRQPKVIQLFLARLGLGSLKVQTIDPALSQSQAVLQGDLFSGWLNKTKVDCLIKPAALSSLEIKACLAPKHLPAVVLFAGPLQVKEFYEQNYEEIQAYANILSQNHSGGNNKLFRNFEIYPKSVLLATDKLILKYLGDLAGGAVATLPVKTLILGHLPFEQYTHPYLEAVAKTFERPFEQFSLPRAIYNLGRVLSFFYTPMLKQVVLADPKLAKDYAVVFKEFIKQIPNLKVREG